MPATVLGFETTTSFRTYRLWRGQIRKLPVVTRKEHCDSGVLGERALGIVLVLSGCCNNIPQLGRLTDCRNVLLTVLEAGSQISGSVRFQGQARALFLVLDFSYLHTTSVCSGGRQ